MESLLSGNKLADELAFFKQQVDILSTQKIKYADSYVQPLDRRSKKAILANIPVCEPPTGINEDEPASVETIKITIKSTKPPLLFTLSATSTSTIATLKAQLSAQEPTAPSPDSQRWILKGKAMGDGKLLREFTVEDGSVVNMMVKPPSSTISTPTQELENSPPLVAVASSSSSTPNIRLTIPELTLSSTDRSQPDTVPSTLPSPSSTSNESAPFLSSASSPELWISTYELLKSTFKDENQAKKVWEAWFGASIEREWITPSQKALIREKSDISAMGGI